MIPTMIFQELDQLFSDYPSVEKVILFGSRARGDFHNRSDIDLFIKAPSLSQADWLQMIYRLNEEINTLLAIDVMRWEESPASLREKIMAEGRVIYERGKNPAKLEEPGESTPTIERSLSRDTHEQPLHRRNDSAI